MCLLALLQDRFVSQDQVTLDSIWHVPSTGHLQQPSSSHFHYSNNTSPYPLGLKETSNSVWDLTSPDAPLALDEKLGRDSAQTPDSRTDQLSTWQIYQHCTSCLEAGNPKTQSEIPQLQLAEMIPELGHKLTAHMWSPSSCAHTPTFRAQL